MYDKKILNSIEHLIKHERDSLSLLFDIKTDILAAVKLIDENKGRIIVAGLGKSGYAARKIAATLSSTGSASIYIHPTEALHGDFGAILPDDIAICISKSGETVEVKNLMAMFKRYGIKIIAITCEKKSTMAENADIALIIPTCNEGDPLGIVPTTSVVATITIGDSIASGLMTTRELTNDQFRYLHPGGSLGRRLSRISEFMHSGDEMPVVKDKATLKDAILEITRKKFGVTMIFNDNNELLGVVTDGDVRRAIQHDNFVNHIDEPALKFASKNPYTISENAIVEEALHLMEEKKITTLVVKKEAQVCGVIHLHDILQERVI